MKLLTPACILVFLFLPLIAVCQRPGAGNIDSAKKVVAENINSDSIYINTCFYIAEKYMMQDLYDSTQVWLNHIAEMLPLRKPSYFNFYLSTYQASTYYYTGLIRMALQESERMERIAREINDSILIGTAHNLIGLSYMNMDSTEKAIPHFLEGIKYIKQPPYAIDYLTSSKPHHMYGNLAECYLKLGNYDKAKSAAYTSKKLAIEIGWLRGAAVADNTLGLAFARTGNIDSAFYFEREAISIGLTKNQPDVSLVSYGALAECFLLQHQNDSALAAINTGFQLLKEKPYLNDLFVKQFLADVIRFSVKLERPDLQVKAYLMKDSITNGLVKKNDAQISLLVKGSVANEMRAVNLEVAEAKHKQSLTNTRLILALVALASMITLFFLYRRYQRKQLREMEIRNRISRDLHDDIGATLSSIKIYGELAGSTLEKDTTQSKKMIGEITGQAKELMSRMGDVIWSMKPVDEEKNTFSNRLKNFSNELLTPKGIECEFDIDEKLSQQVTDPVARKNILLIIKEAMNNIAKYSGAKHCKISLRESGSAAILLITDDGRGIDMENTTRGNGLDNMKERAESLGGKFEVKSSPGTGVAIQCTFPIAIFSHST